MIDERSCSLNRFLSSISDQNNRNPATENMTNIQRLEQTNAIWNQPDYTRDDVDKILQQLEVGIFIVRENSEKIMVLSYKTDNDIQHVRIKKDAKNGIYMDGSQIFFKNINEMICHYMTYSIQSSHLFLKLPRALQEASDINHFNFFVKMKADFWKTSLPDKSINEIFLNSSRRVSQEPYVLSVYNEIKDNESTPTLSLKEFNINDLNSNNGLVYAVDQNKRLKKFSIWKCFICKCVSISQSDANIVHQNDEDCNAMSDKKSKFV